VIFIALLAPWWLVGGGRGKEEMENETNGMECTSGSPLSDIFMCKHGYVVVG
jgi:hypothetical protein